MEKINSLYHITCVTHNSRVSNRMKHYNIKTEAPVKLNQEQEIILTRIFYEIVKENQYTILAYNVCCDHIHFIIFCENEMLPQIICKIKSVSSHRFKELVKIPTTLWAQKFNRKIVDKDERLTNAINYINNNRLKHDLPENIEVEQIASKIVIPIEKIV